MDRHAFEAFVADAEPRLRRALVAAYGPVDGRDATAAALAWAWEHRHELAELTNAVGYLFRVGQSSLRQRRQGALMVDGWVDPPDIEPALLEALRALSVPQRTAVVLVHGYGWPLADAAAALEVSVSTLRNHLARGLAKLRAALEVSADA